MLNASEQLFDGRFLCHVRSIILNFVAILGAKTDGFLKLFVIDIDQGKVGALVGDKLRHFLAQPPSRTSDQDRLTLQVHVCLQLDEEPGSVEAPVSCLRFRIVVKPKRRRNACK